MDERIWKLDERLARGFEFGVPFSAVLGCLGLCLDVSLICMTIGDPLAGQGVLQCQKWCLHASFTVCGGKRMIETLRTRRGRYEKFYPRSMKHCIYG
jgi:hypothetical protein